MKRISAAPPGSIGRWSIEKLHLLAAYLGHPGTKKGFLPATERAGRRYYLDLFAGPGRDRLRDDGSEVDGSPIVALKAGPPPFTRLFFVDADTRNVEQLRIEVKAIRENDVDIRAGDANVVVDDVLRTLPTGYPVFAFLDPRAHELHWRTVAKLAGHKAGRYKIELFILFAYNQALVRYMPNNPAKASNARLVDLVMPNASNWRRLYGERAAGKLKPSQFRRKIVEEYVRGLKDDLNYKFVPAPRLICTPHGRPLYFMVFATDHPAGDGIMQWCLDNVRDSLIQSSFIRYSERY